MTEGGNFDVDRYFTRVTPTGSTVAADGGIDFVTLGICSGVIFVLIIAFVVLFFKMRNQSNLLRAERRKLIKASRAEEK